MSVIVSAAIEESGRAARVTWADGTSGHFHAVWLRDNCQDERSRHPGNGQRLFDILDLPADLRLTRAEPTADGEGLEVVFAPEDHATRFPAGWLRARRYEEVERKAPGWLPDEVEPWGRELGDTLPSLTFEAISRDERALERWLGWVARYGFAVMTGAPRESGTVTRIVELFGFVRETNYGRLFDVRSEADPINLAYTGLGLQVHTDNPYRDPVPGLQLLHCLSNAAEGGDSVVVDGFRAALTLKDERPEAFALLAHHPVRFAYANPTTRLEAKAPMLGLSVEGELVEVRFNNRSLAGVEAPGEAMAAYYAAYRALAEILERPEHEVVFKLLPGDLFIVDNRRVLHGRKAFTSAGGRHLQGCYADRDGLLSTLAVLRERKKGSA
jgi:gamma-butyrobetaine dioxygenase